MDIAKYIGLYLLKNHFCYLHGLGNLQLRKKPAAYTGEALTAPHYNVVLAPGGSIDDNLANFIATAEQTSISKASNNLREFITATRASLMAGEDVPIPAIGYFTQKNGVLDFVTDVNLAYTPPSIPALKMSKRLEEPPSFKRLSAEEETASRSGSINWGKAILTAAALAGFVTGVVLGIRYLDKPTENKPPATSLPAQQPAAQPAPSSAPAPTTQTPQQAAPPVEAVSAPANWRVVVNTYSSRAAAEKRARFLRTTPLGNAVSIAASDSSTYRVVVPYAAAPGDSTRVLDSFSRTYGTRAALLR